MLMFLSKPEIDRLFLLWGCVWWAETITASKLLAFGDYLLALCLFG